MAAWQHVCLLYSHHPTGLCLSSIFTLRGRWSSEQAYNCTKHGNAIFTPGLFRWLNGQLLSSVSHSLDSWLLSPRGYQTTDYQPTKFVLRKYRWPGGDRFKESCSSKSGAMFLHECVITDHMTWLLRHHMSTRGLKAAFWNWEVNQVNITSDVFLVTAEYIWQLRNDGGLV